jgi:catechol 2,3-dioxygenase-like lactoylglutathione lyase family enzyme
MCITTSFKIKNMSAQLLVADVERSIHFYTEKLGFELDFRYHDFYAGIIKDGRSIHLKQSEISAEEIKIRNNNDNVAIIFSVDEIESLYEEITGKSIKIIQSLREMPYGKEFYIADLDENVIAFTT